MDTKKCSKCGEIKETNCFSKRKTSKDGFRGTCRTCEKENFYKYREENKEKELKRVKKWKDENIEHVKKYVEENKARRKLYFVQYNIEHRKQLAEYRIKNIEIKTEYLLKYYVDNKESILKSVNNYRIKNKGKCNILHQRYEARKRKLPCTLTFVQWESIKTHFNNRCAYCGEKLPLAQEHFMPVVKGGEYTHNNIIPSCQSCNSSKGTKDFFTWYPKYKYYSKKREKYILEFLHYKNEIQQLTLTI